jgi:hypothetical protein
MTIDMISDLMFKVKDMYDIRKAFTAFNSRVQEPLKFKSLTHRDATIDLTVEDHAGGPHNLQLDHLKYSMTVENKSSVCILTLYEGNVTLFDVRHPLKGAVLL